LIAARSQEKFGNLNRRDAEGAEERIFNEKLSELFVLCASAVKTILRSHRGGAEDAEGGKV
jgi:hypothetical protein